MPREYKNDVRYLYDDRELPKDYPKNDTEYRHYLIRQMLHSIVNDYEYGFISRSDMYNRVLQRQLTSTSNG